LAKAEERAADERSRCDRLLAENLVANARATHLEGQLKALRSLPVPWWRRWRQANGQIGPSFGLAWSYGRSIMTGSWLVANPPAVNHSSIWP
jgi:hypothetical protein